MREGYERRRAITIAFGALIAVNFVAVLFSMIDLNLLDRIESGELVGDDEIEAHDNRAAAVGLVQTVAYVVCAVVFIRWLHAAHRNLDVVAPGVRRYGHGWAIGAWFVPFMNFWRPKEIVNDVWRGSGTPTDYGRPPVLLLAWWLSWVAGLILGRFEIRAALEQETIDQLRTMDFWFIVSDLWDVANAVMAIAVVRHLTRRLDHRAAVAAAPASPSTWTDAPAVAASPAVAMHPGAWPAATAERAAAPDRACGGPTGSAGRDASLTPPCVTPPTA
jgi:hypothetical protein